MYVYVCIYIYVCICMYVCIYIYLYVCMYDPQTWGIFSVRHGIWGTHFGPTKMPRTTTICWSGPNETAWGHQEKSGLDLHPHISLCGRTCWLYGFDEGMRFWDVLSLHTRTALSESTGRPTEPWGSFWLCLPHLAIIQQIIIKTYQDLSSIVMILTFCQSLSS